MRESRNAMRSVRLLKILFKLLNFPNIILVSYYAVPQHEIFNHNVYQPINLSTYMYEF